MSKKLIIVESPGKIKKITELLDKIKIRIQNNNLFFEEILKNQKDILENK